MSTAGYLTYNVLGKIQTKVGRMKRKYWKTFSRPHEYRIQTDYKIVTNNISFLKA